METANVLDLLSGIIGKGFVELGANQRLGLVTLSDRPDLAQFQCSGAMQAARQLKRNPRDIAHGIVANINPTHLRLFTKVEVAGPGFINMTLTDQALAELVNNLVDDDRQGCPLFNQGDTMVIDYGGYNIAKELHIGHIRSTLIGWCLVKLMRFAGHEVVGDVHLGDWGTQMGMIIEAVKAEQPDLPYFDEHHTGPYPDEPPFTLEDLNRFYPTAAAAHKANEGDNPQADRNRQATAELQAGRRGYLALWQHIVNVSLAEIRSDIGPFGVVFDKWLGESDAQPHIPSLVNFLQEEGFAIESIKDGKVAWVVSVEDELGDGTAAVMIVKSDGGVTYHTTDLATISMRVLDDHAQHILYLTDNRQILHFQQLFVAARKAGLVNDSVGLEHAYFGTIKGPDGKPFKTRSGDTVKLKDVTTMVTDAARKRLREQAAEQGWTDAELEETALKVGMAAIRFFDLKNDRTSDYMLDLENFISFEGKTGPYVQYAAVRIASILTQSKNLPRGGVVLTNVYDQALALQLLLLPSAYQLAYAERKPHHLCTFVFELAQAFNAFYRHCRIKDEEDVAVQAGWLQLCELTLAQLKLVLDLLGIDIPARM